MDKAKRSRIWSKTPVYVAGFERGVRPIGFWSILTTLSIFSRPSIDFTLPGLIRVLRNSFKIDFVSTSLTSDDFPDPDTPLTTLNIPSGISTEMFLRLFSVAPFIFKNNPLPLRRSFGVGIVSLPLKNLPVNEFLFFIIWAGVPAAIMFPPWTPAPGPTSIIQSEASIVSSSCSTTRTLFPRSRIDFNVLISLSLSRWCSPILGSSRTYKTPIKLEPICVAKRIRCASPPDKVPATRSIVK